MIFEAKFNLATYSRKPPRQVTRRHTGSISRLFLHTVIVRVDSGRGQDRTLRGVAPVECAIDGWSRDGEELGKITDGILAGGMPAAEFPLLIIDELGFVPLSTTGAELLFEVFSQRYERGSILVTTNLPFDEWTAVFGSERLTGALLDRLTHHVHILEMNGDSYRLKGSRQDAGPQSPDCPEDV